MQNSQIILKKNTQIRNTKALKSTYLFAKSTNINAKQVYFFSLGWARFGYHIYRLFADQKTWLDAKVCVR